MLRRKKLSPDFSPYSFLRSSKVDASFPFVHLYFYCYIRFLDLFPCFVCRGKRTEQSRTEEALSSSSSCTHFIIFRILEYNFLDFFLLCTVLHSQQPSYLQESRQTWNNVGTGYTFENILFY